ncbi:MAG: VWA domain-containing protein [Hyphomicrobiaceae bacterium]|nr:VWA domain-containing protein [Hyphomicrobiaceae bacterium]
MTIFRHGCAMVARALGLAAMLPAAAAMLTTSVAALEVDAQLGQSVLPTGQSGKVYLRLSLKGQPIASRTKRPPVNIALVLDRSGSMKGERIASAKAAARAALERLAPDDVVALVAYNHEVDILRPASPLGSEHALQAAINRLEADGRTALHSGVVAGAKEVERYLDETKVNRVILLSDGLANVGPSSPRELAELGRKLGAKGISVTTIGLGLDYNEDLMSRLAASSDGNHAFVEDPEDLSGIFASEFGDALSITAKDIEIIIECKVGYKPVRVLGREAAIDGNRIRMKLNQLQGSNERYFVVEIESPDVKKEGDVEIASVSIDYLDLASGGRKQADVRATGRYSASTDEASKSINKSVMTQVTTQIATETSEKAVELRDKGDISGAKKLLEGNATYLKDAREQYGSGAGAAAPASIGALKELEKKQNEAASNLDAQAWEKTRKSMRYDQHKSKMQQSY